MPARVVTLSLLLLQIGDIKKGLKAFRGCGVSDRDFERHVMFVQVPHSLRLFLASLLLLLAALSYLGCAYTWSVSNSMAGRPQCASWVLGLRSASGVGILICRTTCTRCWTPRRCRPGAPSGSST